MGFLRDEIRECERVIKSWEEQESLTNYVPTIQLSTKKHDGRTFYGLYPDLITKEGDKSYVNSTLVWGFQARKGNWPFSYVDSCNFGGTDKNLAKTWGYENAKDLAFSKARKLAGIISRRTNAPIRLEEIELR